MMDTTSTEIRWLRHEEAAAIEEVPSIATWMGVTILPNVMRTVGYHFATELGSKARHGLTWPRSWQRETPTNRDFSTQNKTGWHGAHAAANPRVTLFTAATSPTEPSHSPFENERGENEKDVDVKSKLERAIEHEKKILAAYETLREIMNSAENPDRNSPDWMSLEMAADMAFDAYLKARRRVQRWSGCSTSL
jgi:hypothetical protein